MSTVNFSGLASGLDSATLISQLVQLRRTPINRLESRKAGYNKEIGALGTFRTKLLALQEAARKIDTASEFSALKATSSDEDVLRVTAGGDAAPGNYEIVVDTLARGQKSLSQGYDSASAAVGAGSLVITVGEEETTLEMAAGTSLADLADLINREVDGVGASIIYDGSATGGYRLSLTGEAGAAHAFAIDASGLAGGIAPAFTQTQAATNATLTIDDIPISAASNLVDDVISGLTLDLRAAEPGTIVQVAVSMDAAGVSDQVKGFVDAYNDIFSFLETATAKGGDLASNGSARSIANRLESLMASSSGAPGGRFSVLAQVGVERTRDRTLTFDADEFAEAIEENFASVRDLFIATDGHDGKAALIDDLVEELTDSVDGLFKIGTDALNRKIKNADGAIARYELSLENYRTSLEKKFLAMESQVAALQAQGNYLSSMTFLS